MDNIVKELRAKLVGKEVEAIDVSRSNIKIKVKGSKELDIVTLVGKKCSNIRCVTSEPKTLADVRYDDPKILVGNIVRCVNVYPPKNGKSGRFSVSINGSLDPSNTKLTTRTVAVGGDIK